uniref:GAT domain-containing protein n=1 Tax=Macrostomum lignano TaxID=282301 RepID=A0A1I8HY43_9PLAT
MKFMYCIIYKAFYQFSTGRLTAIMRQLKIRRLLLTVTQTCLLRSDQAMDAVDRIRLSIDDCANQLLVECLGADEADLEMLQSRCYELSGPTAVPASPSPVIQGTVGIEDPAEASGCSLASAVATGFPPGWIRRCQLT